MFVVQNYNLLFKPRKKCATVAYFYAMVAHFLCETLAYIFFSKILVCRKNLVISHILKNYVYELNKFP